MVFEDATFKLVCLSIEDFIADLHEIAQDCLNQKPLTEEQRMRILFIVSKKLSAINKPEDDTDPDWRIRDERGSN
jgi:hypothetical protein